MELALISVPLTVLQIRNVPLLEKSVPPSLTPPCLELQQRAINVWPPPPRRPPPAPLLIHVLADAKPTETVPFKAQDRIHGPVEHASSPPEPPALAVLARIPLPVPPRLRLLAQMNVLQLRHARTLEKNVPLSPTLNLELPCHATNVWPLRPRQAPLQRIHANVARMMTVQIPRGVHIEQEPVTLRQEALRIAAPAITLQPRRPPPPLPPARIHARMNVLQMMNVRMPL